MEGLLELACQTTADMMTGMTVKKLRKTFKGENDFAAEEEDATGRREEHMDL
ncbi:hypothetical protein SAY86_006374 [Trapa natans]|uniref:SKP1 component dimerisation domain-containing protein n=1 Tax=Trapa natans TaxID=22666 RepID=A0AAN7QVZ1_TRANT|nr:hypothetical protein SAY86_006374 [Trapa natans]